MTNPTIGSQVLYTSASGASLPAVVVDVKETGAVNLQVFTNESLPNIRHKTDVEQGDKPEAGKFHFADDVKAEKPAKGHKGEK
jgi:hypothetical protein